MWRKPTCSKAMFYGGEAAEGGQTMSSRKVFSEVVIVGTRSVPAWQAHSSVVVHVGPW